MAIDTVNDQIGIMEWCSIWEPGLPISPGSIGQDDQQQLLGDYPGLLWGGGTVAGYSTPDLNTRMYLYLNDFYGSLANPVELSTLLTRYLYEELTGEYTARFQQLIDDATAP